MGVLTTDDTTFQALDVYNQTYANAKPRTPSEAAAYAVAQLVTQIRNDIWEINDAANGDEAWTPAGVTTRFAGAPSSGWDASYAYAVYGDGTTGGGITVWASSAASTRAGYVFRRGAVAAQAGMAYRVDIDQLLFRQNNADKIALTGSGLLPLSPINLGGSSFPWGASWFNGTLQINKGSSGAWIELKGSNQTLRWIDASDVREFDITSTGGALAFRYGPSSVVAMTIDESDGGVSVGRAGGEVAFYGGTPAAKPTITGSKGGNAALTSLLTQLANLNIITDSTT